MNKNYLKAVKFEKTLALWETQSKEKVTIICTADGTPASAIRQNKPVAPPKLALVPVKKGFYILEGTVGEDGTTITISRVVYPFTNNRGVHLVKIQRVCDAKNGAWSAPVPEGLSYVIDLLQSKLKGFSKRVVAKLPTIIPLIHTKKGFSVYESCGSDESTIVCTPGGGAAFSTYIFEKEEGKAGRQAIVPVFNRYKILRGRQTEKGTEIFVYAVTRISSDKGAPRAEVEVLNHCLDGKWQEELSRGLEPAVDLLIKKIEMTDSVTVFSKMKN